MGFIKVHHEKTAALFVPSAGIINRHYFRITVRELKSDIENETCRYYCNACLCDDLWA